MKALICEKCGAPTKNNRECEYCRTTYYVGPEIPAQDLRPDYILDGFSSVSTCAVIRDYNTGGRRFVDAFGVRIA